MPFCIFFKKQNSQNISEVSKHSNFWLQFPLFPQSCPSARNHANQIDQTSLHPSEVQASFSLLTTPMSSSAKWLKAKEVSKALSSSVPALEPFSLRRHFVCLSSKVPGCALFHFPPSGLLCDFTLSALHLPLIYCRIISAVAQSFVKRLRYGSASCAYSWSLADYLKDSWCTCSLE